jgi:hypothetical protein
VPVASTPSFHLFHTCSTSTIDPRIHFHQSSSLPVFLRETDTDNMAANTKYQAVGQRDSFEQAGYNQPPPSYQAEPVPGEARSEDDNVADDFKVRI